MEKSILSTPDVSSVSLYLIWSRAVKFWTPNVAAGIYKQWLDIDGTCYNKPIMSYYFDNTFTLPHGWLITANISGRRVTCTPTDLLHRPS